MLLVERKENLHFYVIFLNLIRFTKLTFFYKNVWFYLFVVLKLFMVHDTSFVFQKIHKSKKMDLIKVKTKSQTMLTN